VLFVVGDRLSNLLFLQLPDVVLLTSVHMALEAVWQVNSWLNVSARLKRLCRLFIFADVVVRRCHSPIA